MNDLWAEKQQLQAHAAALQAALDVMSRDFAAARAYILNRVDAYTESAIVAIALLQRELRSVQRAAQGL